MSCACIQRAASPAVALVVALALAPLHASAAEQRALVLTASEDQPGHTPASFDEQTGMLTFECERLADIVAESNRRQPRLLLIANDATANLQIGGRVNLTDLATFLDRLKRLLQVQASTTGPDSTQGPVVLSLPDSEIGVSH